MLDIDTTVLMILRWIHFLAGIIWIGLFYATRGAANALTSNQLALAAPAPWIVLAAFSGVGATLLVRTPS